MRCTQKNGQKNIVRVSEIVLHLGMFMFAGSPKCRDVLTTLSYCSLVNLVAHCQQCLNVLR